jgi:hypothetical protein
LLLCSEHKRRGKYLEIGDGGEREREKKKKINGRKIRRRRKTSWRSDLR